MNLKMTKAVVGTLHFNVSENYCFLPVIFSVSFDGGVGVGSTLATDDELSLAGRYVVAVGCTSPVLVLSSPAARSRKCLGRATDLSSNKLLHIEMKPLL